MPREHRGGDAEKPWRARWLCVWTRCRKPGEALSVFLCRASLHHWEDWRPVSYCTQARVCRRCATPQVEVHHWWLYTHHEERPGGEGGAWGAGAPGGLAYWQCRMCGAIKAERRR
jgi:hypothetical protein